MRGHWLRDGGMVQSPDWHHVGRLSFQTKAKVEKAAGAALVIEGDLLRFLDARTVFRPGAALASLRELHEEKGEAFVSHLDGLFLLLFAPAPDLVFLVNNRHQATRLYYTERPRGFFFSSSLKDLIHESGLAREPDFGAVRSFLANGFTISERTQIKGASKMLPADFFRFGESVERKTYWPGDLKFERQKFKNLSAHLDRYEDHYRSGLKRYLDQKPGKRVGTLLSGGHDTSFLVAQASQVVDQPLQAFTVTFPGWQFDESRYAENVAKKFGAVFHPVPFESKHVDRVVSLILANEEPVVGSSLPLHVLAEAARGKVDVMLGGDGGDTLWGEYYPVGEYHRLTRRLPLLARQGIHRAARFLRDLTDWERFWELEHVSGLFAEADYHRDFLRKLCTYRHFDEKFQSQLLRPQLRSTPYARPHLEVEFRDDNFSDVLVEGKLYNGFYTYQSHHTTKLMEYLGMELFLPTVDKSLMDFICRLPRRWINGGTALHRLANNKRINRRFHKRALARYFRRDEIYNRSFDIPWYQILKPRPELLAKLQARLHARGWYQPDALDRLFREFMDQEAKPHELLELKHHGYRIFTLLSLEIWCLEYLDGRGSRDEADLRLEDYLG